MNRNGLRRRSMLRAARAIAATVFAVAGATAIGDAASACSGPYVTAGEAISAAPRIALVRTAAIHGDPTSPDGYDFVVEEAYRGSFPPVLRTAAPQYHACGDRIVAAPGERLVIFFDVPAFTGQPPMNPYWRIGQGGMLAPDGIDAEAGPWETLDQLRAAFANESDEDDSATEPIEPSLPPAPPALSVVGLIAAGAVIALGVAYLLRR